MNFRKIIFVLLSFSVCFNSLAQQSTSVSSVFNPRELFAQDLYNSNGNEFRSANGAPGPKYWQNRADYNLQATIDTNANQLKATESIHYVNNSPDQLSSLWLQMEQNIYKEEARSNFFTASTRRTRSIHGGHTDGFELKNVTITYKGKRIGADYIITDTRMQIRLHQPLLAKENLTISIQYQYSIPGEFGGRTDYFNTRNGKIYEIAQWYPRMCVYDDLHGWNTLPYLGSGEFYCEYGDFDYSVTVPNGMIVAGSGELVNTNEVLSVQQKERLAMAEKSDKTIMIRTVSEVNKAATDKEVIRKKTWHFKMKNTRDVAFGLSKAYVWDAARVNLPGGKKCMAMSGLPG